MGVVSGGGGGGGGSTPVQAFYSGNAVSVGDGLSVDLTFDSLDDGVELLDRSSPDVPTFLAAGTYALMAQAYGGPLTVGGTAILSSNVAGAAAITSTSSHPELAGFGETLIAVAAAGDPVNVAVGNFDGAAAHDFQLITTTLIKLA